MLLSRLPADLPRAGEIGIDLNVLWFTLAIPMVTGILFGLAPIFQTRKLDLQESLKESSRGAGTGVRGTRLHGLLVVAETALAFVLLVGAGPVDQELLAPCQRQPRFRRRPSPDAARVAPRDSLPHRRRARGPLATGDDPARRPAGSCLRGRRSLLAADRQGLGGRHPHRGPAGPRGPRPAFVAIDPSSAAFRHRRGRRQGLLIGGLARGPGWKVPASLCPAETIGWRRVRWCTAPILPRTAP
jgi:hypothetical protein